MNTRTSYQILTTTLFTLVVGCGNVTAISRDGGDSTSTGGQGGESVKLPGTGGQGGETSSPGTGGTSVSTGGATAMGGAPGTGGSGGEGSSLGTGGEGSSLGTGGSGGEGSSPGTGGQATADAGTDAVSITGLTGSYFASARGAAYITRIDPTVDFDPGPANFEPEEVTWTGEINTDNTAAVEIQGNDTDIVSMTIQGQATTPGSTGLTGLPSTIATFGGWQTISVDIKRSDMTSPFKAILIRQLTGTTTIAPVPTEALRPE
jgi:hypothetical protein